MSPRAACRLESLGFRAVYDYVPGKSDWLARGVPTVGTQAATRRAHDLARADVVRAALTDPVEELTEHLADSVYPFAIVVSEQGTLLGRLPATFVTSTSVPAVAETAGARALVRGSLSIGPQPDQLSGSRMSTRRSD